jgi:hypothetical protein
MNKQNHLYPTDFFRLVWITSALLFLYLPFIQAQDTVVKRNDEKVIAKIIEVNQNDVKYKRFDYQEGPTFTVVKWELKYIVYGNGVKESFENISAPKLIETPIKDDLSFQPAGRFYYYKKQKLPEQSMLDIAWKLQDKKINLFIRKTEANKLTKNCFFVGGFIVGVAGLLTYTGVISNSSTGAVGRGPARAAQRAAREKRQRTGEAILLGGVGCELVSLVFNFKETRHAVMVVDLYNKTIHQ